MYMPYKDTWGEKAKARSKKRTEYFNNYRKERDKTKIRARAKVYQAIQNGHLTVQPCTRLGIDCHGRMEAHHTDYSKPLDVVWLCSYHHRKADAEMGKVARIPTGLMLSQTCLSCDITIAPPKRAFCSAKCNLRYWRANNNLDGNQRLIK